AAVTHLCHVADAPEDAVRDPRRAPCAPGDLVGRLVCDVDLEDSRRAPDDGRQLVLLVVPEPEGHPEPVTERRRQQPGAGRGPDESERRQVERQRPCAGALADDDVEPKVLERGIEDLLDRAVDPVDLVHEEHVAVIEPGEDRRHVALALERGPRHRPDPDAELLADDRRERRLAEAGRSDEENVVECFATPLGCFQRDVELLLRALLADEVVESARSEGLLDLLLALAQSRRQELTVHAALRSASRTRSSAGRSGSTRASACSASTTE